MNPDAPDFVPQSLRAYVDSYSNSAIYEQAVSNADVAHDYAFVASADGASPDPQVQLFSEPDKSENNLAFLDVPVVDPNQYHEPVSSEKFHDEENAAGAWHVGASQLSVQSLVDDNDAVFHPAFPSSVKLPKSAKPPAVESEKVADAKRKYGDFASGWIRYEFGKDSSASLARCEVKLRSILNTRTKVVGIVGDLMQSNQYAAEDTGDGSLFYAIASGSLPRETFSLTKGMLEHREFADRERTLITMYVKSNIPVIFLQTHGMFAPLAAEEEHPMERLERVATLSASGGDFIKLFEDWQYTYAKAVSLIFSFSHIVVWLSKSSGMSLNDLRLLKLVDTYRLSVAEELRKRTRENMGGYEHFSHETRLCTPRLLIVYPKGSLALYESSAAETEPEAHEQHIEQLYDAVHRCDHHLYECLFKSRLIAGDSVGSGLVVLRDVMPAVHFIPPSLSESGDDAAQPPVVHPSKLFYSTLTEVDHFCVAERCFYSNLDEFVGLHLAEMCDCNYKGAEFHNDWSFPTVLPHCRDWLHGMTRAYKFVFSNYEHISAYNRNRSNEPLRRQLCVMDSMQRSICYSAVQRAFSAFKRGIIPSTKHTAGAVVNAGGLADGSSASHILTKWDYDAQLLEATKVFFKRARGSELYLTEYATLLRYRCWRYYERHQPCGVLSLYGSPCLRRPHITPEESDDADAIIAAGGGGAHAPLPEAALLIMRKLPPAARARVLWHKANFEEMIKCVCPCGRTLGLRDEPFSVRDANWALFKKLRKVCCSKLAGAKEPSCNGRPSAATGSAAAAVSNTAKAAAAAAVLAAADDFNDDAVSYSQILPAKCDEPKQQQQRNRRRRRVLTCDDDDDDDDEEEEEEPEDEPDEDTDDDDADSPIFAENTLLSQENENMNTSRRYGKSKTFFNDDAVDAVESGQGDGGGDGAEISISVARSKATDGAENLKQKNRQTHRRAAVAAAEFDEDVADAAAALAVEQPVHFANPAMHQEGMLPGTIPLFPSWQLFCVGPSHCYNHESGLRPHFQPGFLASFCHLIPFIENVELKREHVITVKRMIGGGGGEKPSRDRGGKFCSMTFFSRLFVNCKKLAFLCARICRWPI